MAHSDTRLEYGATVKKNETFLYMCGLFAPIKPSLVS